ncbi:alpha/beta hydrolase [Nocardia cyriacigeorgica]|uniref:alpha/beta fold hydrolase n=1 Tax=Nocardia cyriacigeorgica TaxID=135487 RepID=UPI0018961FD1|nr:alpha/beta hydrolase [Nocardia cyriacigeorgica]MBF6158746.1 alpha/beta hydrolase [Nocardia cyriacigeorgica]MBF6197568.1 alpha/beta hydrolase [Nocardia cyriacigeorgica]MBF6316434.1 alpha/beta hydrolase [Nocardia cyriacigeorgica]MBF6517375.1 alpha/beta hydrolase [Nocardia cyriacigeorgica]MBF6534751.1 alpha/beta hydrolase [Nocardia cyriacigeorgica]
MSSANNLVDPVRLRLRGSGGIELAADRYGPAEGPLVVFLHGGGQTRHSWKQTGAKLAATGMRVVTLDARGHGDSQWSAARDYRRETMVEDLIEVLGQLGGPAVVVGASMGGITGLLATAVPGGDQISALVLVDIVTRPEPEGVQRVLDFLGKHRDGFDSLDEVADAVAEYMPHRPRPDNTDGLRRNLRQRDGRWYWHWDPDMLADRAEDPSEITGRMEEVARTLTIPVLLVRGLQSDVVSAEGAAAFQELVPHARMVEIGGAAHTAAGDDNDAFTDAVAEFILTLND